MTLLINTSQCFCFLFLTQPQYYYQFNKHNSCFIPPNMPSMFKFPAISHWLFCLNEDPKRSIQCVCIFSLFLACNCYIDYFSVLTIFIWIPFSVSFICWRNHRNLKFVFNKYISVRKTTSSCPLWLLFIEHLLLLRTEPRLYVYFAFQPYLKKSHFTDH